MIAKQILGRPVRLATVLIALLTVLSVLHGNAGAAIIWSEDFDSLAPGTVLTNATMPGWNIVDAPGQGAGRMITTSESAASAPNSIRGFPSQRGTMFRDAAGVNEIRFSFYRQASTTRSADSAVGFTLDQTLDIFNQAATRQVFFFSNSQAGLLGFRFRESGISTVQWDLSGILSPNVWYDGLIRLELNNTATFGYKTLAASNFTLSAGHALMSGFAPNYVSVTAQQHSLTDGRSFLDNVSGHAANVIPEPASIATWTMLSLAGLFFTWRRRQHAA